MYRKHLPTALLFALVVAGCDNTPTGLDGGSEVAIRFGTAGTTQSASGSYPLFSTASTGDLVVQGTNGTLTITNVSFIVSELELEADDGACDGIDKDGCPDFEAPPSFVRLPLGSGSVEIASMLIPAGTYQELEFEVENLEADEEDDSEKKQQINQLLSSVRQAYPDFPENASMVVEGNFNGTPFRVYFDSEIEVEMDLVPSLTLSDLGASRELVVDVQPAMWFKNIDGTVMDLAQLDFARTGRLVEFELEMEQGFVKVEFDD